jgi:hypothetical protein
VRYLLRLTCFGELLTSSLTVLYRGEKVENVGEEGFDHGGLKLHKKASPTS